MEFLWTKAQHDLEHGFIMTFTQDQKEALSRLAFATLWISLIEMLYLTVALIVALIKVCKNMKFRFLVRLILLILISDFSTIFLNVGLYLETTSYHEKYPEGVALLVGITTLFFNFGANVMHWFFALKYWIIANEVPKLFQGKQVLFKEKQYRIINWLGFFINVVPCACLAVVRGLLSYQSG